jgi:hypothetical protein
LPSLDRKTVALLLVSLAFTATGRAASPTPAGSAASPPRPPPACTAAEFRQFDFWLGKWKVRDTQGKQVGTSEISGVSEGCAIREQWTSASGQGGTSINYYEATEQKWHQDWVGGDGTILHLRGNLRDGAMVLSGESKGARGTIINRITWTPLPDGKVKQHWETSTNTGKSWTTSFTGIYEKEA